MYDGAQIWPVIACICQKHIYMHILTIDLDTEMRQKKPETSTHWTSAAERKMKLLHRQLPFIKGINDYTHLLSCLSLRNIDVLMK